MKKRYFKLKNGYTVERTNKPNCYYVIDREEPLFIGTKNSFGYGKIKTFTFRELVELSKA